MKLKILKWGKMLKVTNICISNVPTLSCNIVSLFISYLFHVVTLVISNNCIMACIVLWCENFNPARIPERIAFSSLPT